MKKVRVQVSSNWKNKEASSSFLKSGNKNRYSKCRSGMKIIKEGNE
jgi:hypothetical protein